MSEQPKTRNRIRLIPGCIPDGWKPGDFVHVIAATPNGPGAVVHAPKGLEAALMGDDAKPGDIAMIRYAYDETPDVAHWLAWWQDVGAELRRMQH